MLCYVFQTDGQLLCYFPLEADTHAAVETADRQARQEAFYDNLSSEEKKQFIAFCKGKGKKRCLDTASLVLCLQQSEVALFAERYGCSRPPLPYPNGLLLHLVSPSILGAMNTQYRSKDALVLAILQHTTPSKIKMDTLFWENMPHVMRYLLHLTKQVCEIEQRCAYHRRTDGYIVEEALDIRGIVSFLAKELPKLPMFDTIQICCDESIWQFQNSWVKGMHLPFLYIHVLLIYFVSIVSCAYRSHIQMEQSGDRICFRVYGILPQQIDLIESTNDMELLIQQFPFSRGFLLVLQWLLTRNAVPYTYQIAETEQGKHRLEVCLYFQSLSQDEIVFRHPTDTSELASYLPEVEYLLYMLLGGDVPEM